MNIITIGENANYRIFVGTGSMYLQEFYIHADSQADALALIADYCEEHDLHWLYADHYELADLCDTDETVAEYAARQDLTECGEYGIYMQIKGIEEI